jgi:hypothetical protein
LAGADTAFGFLGREEDDVEIVYATALETLRLRRELIEHDAEAHALAIVRALAQAMKGGR